MRKPLRLLAPLAAVGIAGLLPGVASASTGTSTSYQVQLNPLNHEQGSGNATITVNGSQATIHERVSGLAATFMGGPFPHAQHFHVGAAGTCPTMSDDKNGDGVVSTTEAAHNYGPIHESLTTTGDTSPNSALAVKRFPGGASFYYNRTVQVDSATVQALQNGTAVFVVHGDDPSLLSKQAQNEKSDLDPKLPLAATAPALCGVIQASQMGAMPSGTPSPGPATASSPQARP